VTYQGSYTALQDVEMSAAYASTLNLSFDVRGGLFIRQMHHWAALLFIAAIVVHMLRIFFTGAFRKPRELNWIIGVALFWLAFLLGFTGYSLPDDRSEEHTSELQSRENLVCRLLLEKKKKTS